jgi:thiol-disulfide isomerase/thioredoxin
MKLRSGWLKKHSGKVLNISLITIILLLIFIPDTKSWMMRQLIRTGFFNAKPDKKPEMSASNISDFELTFVDTAGNHLSVASLKGKIVFINFWATWCSPCRAEMPSLNKLYQEFEDDKDIVFLFVSEDEDLSKAIEYQHAHQYHFPLYSTSGGSPGNFYSGTLPTTLVFDKGGKLFHKHEGMANYNTSKFISSLRALK